MDELRLKNLGQIESANLTFGDLTVFVGPQATGKSIALQMLKLILDTRNIQDELEKYGLDWSGKLPEFLDVYFGEGMRHLWHANRESPTKIFWNNKPIDLPKYAERKQRLREESLFLIPAQRVLTLRDGWPRPFTDYSPGDPFAVRQFSEKLRELVEREFGVNEDLFPQKNRLKKEYRELISDTLFANFKLQVDKSRVQKRLVLDGTGKPLPYMVWSAGQREFVPLLLGLYWLLPPSKSPRRGEIRWVVIEELEMGLHPRAISVLLLIILELMSRDYRVCLSTHSPQVLEAVWAIRHLQECNASPDALLSVFGLQSFSQPMKSMAGKIMDKRLKVHYFDAKNKSTRDISDLDPDSEMVGEAGWGGLAEFSTRANNAVADAVNRSMK